MDTICATSGGDGGVGVSANASGSATINLNIDFDAILNWDKPVESAAASNIRGDVGICKLCGIAMVVEFSGDHKCPECGVIEYVGSVQDCDGKDIVGYTTTSAGGYRGYYGSNNYARKQEKDILSQLDELAIKYRGPAIPHHIRVKAGQWYNDIQKILIDTPDGERKFVKRGDIKDEVLGKLIKYECDRAGIARMDCEIARFMGLPSAGLSRGESILRKLHTDNKIELPINIDPTDGFVNRYLDCLVLPVEYKPFVVDLIDVANANGIGLRSIASSKVVGAIWVLVQKEKLPITIAELDKKCDIRVNTFKKFSDAVMAKLHVFVGVFERHGISHGIVARKFA
jgi:transcription initiation factor TFIIIB Brf1 subunit/transcription initiation factor TFIIB